MSGGVLGAVLAGGRSSRFGSDKAAVPLDGRTLLDHAAAALAPQVDAIVVVGRPHPALSWTLDHPVPDLGPLGGLCGALIHALGRGFKAVVTVGCDMPLIPFDVVKRLAGDEPAAVVDCPILGWWPVSLAEPLSLYLKAGGDRAVRRWVVHVGARAVAVGPIQNVNTPADLLRIRRRRG